MSAVGLPGWCGRSRYWLWRRSRDGLVPELSDQYALAQEIEVRASIHLSLQRLDPVHGALDGSGAVREGEPGDDGVVVVAEVAGEGGERGQGLAVDAVDPGVEALALELGEHAGEVRHVGGEGVELGASGADALQRELIIGGQPIRPGHDPADGVPHGRRNGARRWGSTAVPEPAEVEADGLVRAAVAHLCDLVGELGGVGDTGVPAKVEVLLVPVDLAGAFRGLRDELVDAGGVGVAAHGLDVQLQGPADRGATVALSEEVLDLGVAAPGPHDDRLFVWADRRRRRARARRRDDGRLVGGRWLGERASVGGHGLLDRLAQVAPQVEPVRYLDGVGRAGSGTLGVGAAPVPADHLHAGVSG